MKLEGAMTAVISPFTDEDRVDLPAWRKILKAQLDGGIQGLVVAGTTGESATLSSDEKRALLENALELAAGKVPVILGTGTNDTKGTVAATKEAKAWGANAALVVCPYYNKPTQEGLFLHFKAVWEETGLPIFAYNVPGRTASDLHAETIARLVEAGCIVSVKDATADMPRAIDTLALVPKSRPFTLMSGDDFTILPFIACGGVGVTSVVSNILPADVVKLVAACRANDWETARPLQKRLSDLSRVLFLESNPIPIKYLMSMAGYCKPHLRLPLALGSEATLGKLRAAAEAYGGIL